MKALISAALMYLLAVVNAPYTPSVYACSGATYVANFPYLAKADLVVTGSATGLLALTTDYTVNLSSSSTTGTVTLLNSAVTCPNGGTITITRNTLKENQPTSFRQQINLNQAVYETSFDRAAMQTQELNATQSGVTPANLLSLLGTENTWTAKQTYLPSVNNKTAIVCTGTGTQPGVSATGGGTNGVGGVFHGTGNGDGAQFTAPGTGNGITVSSSAGYGGVFTGGANFDGLDSSGGLNGDGIRGTSGITGGVGVRGYSGAANGTGIDGTGSGSGQGVRGNGGGSSGSGGYFVGGGPGGIGVQALGVGIDAGGYFSGGSTSGIGAVGNGGTPNGDGLNGHGVGSGRGLLAVGGASGTAGVFTANSTSAPVAAEINLVPLAKDPTTTVAGDMWITQSPTSTFAVVLPSGNLHMTGGQCALGTSCAGIAVGASRCVCSDQTAIAACKALVTGTSLTITGTGADVINYFCF